MSYLPPPWHNLLGKRAKQGQMELVGLVIIVILITLGMLFMALFALNDDQQKKTFTRKGLASSTLSAIMKTTLPQEECVPGIASTPKIGQDIIEDCALHYTSAEGYSQYRCRNQHSCLFLRTISQELLNATLSQWNKHYELHLQLIPAKGAAPTPLLNPPIIKGGCPRTIERDSSGPFPLQTSAGLVEVELFLCD